MRSDTELLVKIRARLAAGYEPDAIAEELKVTRDKVTEASVRILQLEVDRFNGSPEENFGRYSVFMSERIRELQELSAELTESRQGNARVGAIKAQADLYDRIVNRGEELGVIVRRTKERAELVGMGNVEIAAIVERRLSEVRSFLVEETGKDLLEVTSKAPIAYTEQRGAPRRPAGEGSPATGHAAEVAAARVEIKRKAASSSLRTSE